MSEDAVIVIGNGESRRHINLQRLTSRVPLVGCNAVHRDAIVDHLVCCDQRMIREALKNVNNCQTLIYVRPEWYFTYRKLMKNKNIRSVPDLPYKGFSRQDEPRNWGSGVYALIVAALLEPKNIYVLGFDLYGIRNKVNNIYKDTEHYAVSTKHAIDPSYWIYQGKKVFTNFPNKNFIVVNKDNWKMPSEWDQLNVSFITLENFQERFNDHLSRD
jgi:hypothetical protein